ncbi:PE-PPE domain-containing protein [Streptomyces sp. CT34]|uniref:cutinase family protein n=1 Tax=Streptomyces sp. CT34 TaxID=1553907 RepID=UPI000B2DAA9C|nr:PE-PPE domain-containing protein [Streptomyces sp. CT34]
MVVGTAVFAPAVAQADSIDHYYIEIGGTTGAADQPECTTNYRAANQKLQPGSWVPVCYPASAGPWENGRGGVLDLNAPSYDDSVNQGYHNLLAKIEDTHRDHPDARLTVVGYSQGAQAADQVLQTIANGATDIPRSQVNGMLYADPMQPGTGFTAQIPKGVGLPGFTSPGAGPAEFNGIPVARYCIHGDPVCDASLVNAPGYFTLHGTYPLDGNVMTQTIADDGHDGVQWRNPGGGPA